MTKIFPLTTVKAWLLVGTLDILAACIQFFLKTNKNPITVLRFVASGYFGKEAFTGGDSMIIYGLLLHFLVASLFTLFFFLLAYYLPAMLKYTLFTGIFYGIFMQLVMQFLVLPLSNAPKVSHTFLSVVIATSILIICIGIPLAFIAGRKLNTGK
ncbi:MAG: hypothetical protein K2Q21_15210 [Chitinophagaceae bacterium]|nr:hypothetical protein [Chitinophagaceae bacterium]